MTRGHNWALRVKLGQGRATMNSPRSSDLLLSTPPLAVVVVGTWWWASKNHYEETLN